MATTPFRPILDLLMDLQRDPHDSPQRLMVKGQKSHMISRDHHDQPGSLQFAAHAPEPTIAFCC